MRCLVLLSTCLQLATAWQGANSHAPKSHRAPLLSVLATSNDKEAALLAPADLPLLKLSSADVRSKSSDQLEGLIDELEAAAANYADKAGKPSVTLSRLLATAHTCYGDHESSVPHAKAALAEGGEDADMHFLLGVAAERRDDEDEALSEYETALSLDPKCWRALFHVGKIALACGAIDMGIEQFRKVQSINPDHAATNAFLATYDASSASVGEEDSEVLASSSPPFEIDQETVRDRLRSLEIDSDDDDDDFLPQPETLKSFYVDPGAS